MSPMSYLINREGDSAEMFLIGGHGDKKKKKDVWKLNLSCFKEPNYHWTRLSDLEVPTHRCFTFAVDSKENKVEKILKGSLD